MLLFLLYFPWNATLEACYHLRNLFPWDVYKEWLSWNVMRCSRWSILCLTDFEPQNLMRYVQRLLIVYHVVINYHGVICFHCYWEFWTTTSVLLPLKLLQIISHFNFLIHIIYYTSKMYISWCIAKYMYLENSKRIIIWNGGSKLLVDLLFLYM